jgi:glucose-6-phosphate dehydrogenase assembly protein OpcA
MGAEMTGPWPERALGRILDALEREIIAMSDEEIATVLEERGMSLRMQGSAALTDLGYFASRRTVACPEETGEPSAPDEGEDAATPDSSHRGEVSTRH